MPAKLTLFPGRGASRYFLFREGRNQLVGRDPASDLILEDSRVSARHALFQPSGGGWLLVDLRSKNGTFVNGARISEVPLQDGDWISFGGLIGRHERIGDAEVEALLSERSARLQAFVDTRRTLDSYRDGDALWKALLPATLALAGAERGFAALFSPAVGSGACVAAGFPAFEPLDEAFGETFAAIGTLLETEQSVVFSRRRGSAGRQRASLAEIGARAGMAVPIRRSGAVAGLIVVEGRRGGGGFTDLDLEILEAIADYAGVALDRRSASPRGREHLGARETTPGAGRSFLDELEERVTELVRAAREASASQP